MIKPEITRENRTTKKAKGIMRVITGNSLGSHVNVHRQQYQQGREEMK
jgi:hypothetical protein